MMITTNADKKTRLLEPRIEPAFPGYFRVSYHGARNGEPESLSVTPVIAWAIQLELSERNAILCITTTPVTVEDTYPNATTSVCILTPHGEYIFGGDLMVNTKDDALAQFRRLEALSTIS